MTESDQSIGRTADPGHVKKASKKEKKERKEELDDLQFLLARDEGRRFIWRILCFCSAFRTVWDPKVEGIYFNEGRKQVAYKLFQDIQDAEPMALVKMQVEALERDQKEEAEKNE